MAEQQGRHLADGFLVPDLRLTHPQDVFLIPMIDLLANSLERNRDNCASRHAFASGSPARHRRINSVINGEISPLFYP